MEDIAYLGAKISSYARTPKILWIPPKIYTTTHFEIDETNLSISNRKVVKDHILTLTNTKTLWKEEHLKILFQTEYTTAPLRCHPFHRAKIVQWLSILCFNNGLDNQTLFLAVRLMDRVLEKIGHIPLKLLALECFFIASKYEMDFCFDVNDIRIFSNYKFSKKEIKTTEIQVLQILNYDILAISSLDFIVHFNEFDTNTFLSIMEFCEMMLLYSEMQISPPSLIAAAAVYLGRCINIGVENLPWSENDINKMKHDKTEIIAFLKRAYRVIDAYKALALTTIKNKYVLIK